jgi:hypothetical protein
MTRQGDQPPDNRSMRDFLESLRQLAGFPSEEEQARQEAVREAGLEYLKDACRSGYSRFDVNEVMARIRDAGYWEHQQEWRIFTTMSVRIEPDKSSDPPVFVATVRCDGTIQFRAPTLERALERIAVYSTIEMDLFYASGWSSWASQERMEPNPDEHTP